MGVRRLEQVMMLVWCLSACGDDGPGMPSLPTHSMSDAANLGEVGSPVSAGDDAGSVAGRDGGVADADSAATQSASGCSAEDSRLDGPALHAAAASVLTVMSPCGFSSCHQGNGKAGLALAGATDLNALLVGKTACEAPTLSLVDGSGGDAALNRSWLWLKLVAPYRPGGTLEGHPDWGTPGACGQVPPDSYGVLMPLGATEALDEARLGPIRDWICAGAPGPT